MGKPINYEKLIKDFYKTFIGGYSSIADPIAFSEGKLKYRESVFILDKPIDITGNKKASDILTKMFYITYPEAGGNPNDR